MTTNTFTEQLPVPQVLQEALKDYPELVDQLKKGLQSVGRHPGMTTTQLSDQFEAATWVMEGILEKATVDAAASVRHAEEQGDRDRAESAKRTLQQLDHCYTVIRRMGVRELRALLA